MTTWRMKLSEAMKEAGDSGPVVSYAPSLAAFDVEFNCGFGGTEGPPVLAWTDTRVYFPVEYDGAEWLGSAPRHPQAEGQEHQGGG
jgi:hypothetical protein